VKVSVLHAGFDAASYALMVGVYADEEMSGAERFLDDQFAELLSGWRDMGRYPGALGTSVFVTPGVDVDDGCRPIGAYLVGLGTALTLNRRQLEFAVRQALVDRCVRLYPPVSTGPVGPDAEPKRIRVGVASALLGVRDDESLRVEDAVAGILEAVQETNHSLEHFELERRMDSQVRVAAVEFVERFAHRANLAAMAIRRIRSVPGLSGDFVELDKITVHLGDGGLPMGAALIEKDRSWRRLVITEQTSANATRDSDSARPLVVEVSALAREARSDRVIHRIDRVSLDALIAMVSANWRDDNARRAMRDRLIPYSMRADFLTTESVQLVLDQATANFPWELLAVPISADAGSDEPAKTGSVLRLFTETGGGRLQPERARVGSALVIGAGNVEGVPYLRGAIEEAEAVDALLGAPGPGIECTLLTDREKPLDIARLNVELLGDHQIVHLACHGIHVEGDRYATGAVLTHDLRLTVDLVESMPIVPELVFINSCYNGRIGVSPLAAGLARALIDIGVRAVVAAGWPVGDAAAKAFAESFYASMTRGVTFGDAVAQARVRSAAEEDGATWAAYQCYGDPTFVLRGRAAEVAAIGDPVGLSDLQARLGALATRAADLSRPRPTALNDRRERLVETYRMLEKWVQDKGSGVDDDPEVWRLLGRAARELGEFGSAADWYTRFAGSDGRPAQGVASPHDLQQAANCVARDAQADARDAQPAPEEDGATATGDKASMPQPQTSHERLPEALGRFRRAVELAEGSIAMLSEDEGWAILASVYKKWATVDPDDRDHHLNDAVEAYTNLKARQRGQYGVENRLQITAVHHPAKARKLADLFSSADSAAAQHGSDQDSDQLVDGVSSHGQDFWARVALGDRALTRLMLAGDQAERDSATKSLLNHYREAFRGRSTYAERSSSVDHLSDLREVLPDNDERKPCLDGVLKELNPWSRPFTPATSSTPEAQPATPTPVGEPTTTRGSVTLTAFHAACGDCLCLEYAGNDGRSRQLLIDGGLGSAFKQGLGMWLDEAVRPKHVDVAVVTHVDGDHIEGMLYALREGRLRADDMWFNGRQQLIRQFPEAGARTTTQGDTLSRLIPDTERNLAVNGSAFVVQPGQPSVVPLPGGARAVLLSPSEDRLKRLLTKWPEPSRDVTEPSEDEVRISTLEDELERGVVVERGPGRFGGDTSVANGSSIAFLFEHLDVSVLLTGDAYASVLTESIQTLLNTRGLEKLKVDIFKLPHHGSRQNITDDLLTLVDPRRILVCTDGSKYEHPDEDAIVKVRQHYPNAEICFTDRTPITEQRASLIGGVLPTASPTVIEV
jgi:beta-lactamase superfamily II metal-dependent hydrolase